MALGNIACVQYGAIVAASTTVTLTRICRTLEIILDAGSSDVYIELNGNTATVGGATCFKIAGGGSWKSPARGNLGIQTFKYIGSGTTGNMAVIGI